MVIISGVPIFRIFTVLLIIDLAGALKDNLRILSFVGHHLSALMFYTLEEMEIAEFAMR